MRKAQINELSRLDVGGNAGCIYEEYYDKGKHKGYSRNTRYIRYVAEIVVAGERFRHRSMDRKKVEDFSTTKRHPMLPRLPSIPLISKNSEKYGN